MPKYKCLNKKCSKYNTVDARSSKGIYDKVEQKAIDLGAICPECGENCELQFEGYSTNLKNMP